MTLGPRRMPARSALPAPPALHPPWPHGSWRHGPQCLHASTANPLLCGSWPHGPMVPWPCASRPNQMSLKGPSACPPAPPAPLAPPFPRSTRPPWPSTPMAPMAPSLRPPWPPWTDGSYELRVWGFLGRLGFRVSGCKGCKFRFRGSGFRH